MCGGKKEEKVPDVAPIPDPLADAAATPPPEDPGAAPLTAPEEPQKVASVSKSNESKASDTKMAAGVPSLALTEPKIGGGGAGVQAPKNQSVAKSMAGGNAKSLALQSNVQPAAKGGASQAVLAGAKSVIKETKTVVKGTKSAKK